MVSMKRMKKAKSDESGEGSESDDSDTADFLPATQKGQASKAQLKEEVDDEEESENGSENENGSMTSKGTSGKTGPAKQEVPPAAKRGREDKTEREPEPKKMKPPVNENGSKMEEEPQKKSHKASKKAGKAEKSEKSEKAEKAENAEEGDKGLEKSNQKKSSRKQKKQLQEESEKPETSKEKHDKVKSTPEMDKQEVTEAAPPKSSGKKQGNSWSPKDEYILAKQMLEDLKAGLDFHNKPKNDSYWVDLCESLKGKLEGDFSKDQIHDKHRRMKSKYEKLKIEKSGRRRTPADEELQTVFKQLFDREVAKEKDVAAAKEAESNVALKIVAGIQSDGEEINEHMDTSEPVVPALEPKKWARNGYQHLRNDETKLKNDNTETSQEVTHQLGQMMKDFQTAIVETMLRASMVSRQPAPDPILASVTAGLPSLISSYKLGFEAASGNSEDMRKRFLEDKILEYSTLKRKLELLLDYYKLEEELVKKELEALQ